MKTLTKKEIVSEFNSLYGASEYAVFVDFKGMNAENTAKFRGELRKNGLKFKVVKNTLSKKAMEGTDYSAHGAILKGQCGVIFCDDLMKVAKVINQFCFKENSAKFIACANKNNVCDEAQIKELASLPSMEVLRTKLLYMLNSTGSALVRALNEAVEQGRKNCPGDKE